MNNLPINEKALKQVTDMFNEGRIRNVAYLISHYSQKELSLLNEACLFSANMIKLGAENGKLHEAFNSIQEAMVFQSFLITQGQLIERALLYNEGIHVMNMTTLEGVETLKIYNN